MNILAQYATTIPVITTAVEVITVTAIACCRIRLIAM
jgi:hypothetical protein